MRRIIFCIFISLLSICATAQDAREPVLKSYGIPVYPPKERRNDSQGQVTVQYQINDQGEAISLSMSGEYPELWREAAEIFIKSWKFEIGNAARDPKTIYKTILEYRLIHGMNDPGDTIKPTVHAISFHYFEITSIAGGDQLTKCPVGAETDVPSEILKGDFVEVDRGNYSVRVDFDGSVVWQHTEECKHQCRQTGHIEAADAHALLEKFQTKEFWSYCGNYDSGWQDLSGEKITVKIGGKTRTIAGDNFSSPDALQELEREVDRTAGTHRWLYGDPTKETIFAVKTDFLPKPGQTPLMDAASAGRIYQVKKLIDAGSNVNAVDASGWSALMYTVGRESSEIEQLLLQSGADPNLSSHRGETALMTAALNPEWDDDLVKAGARTNAQNQDGQTALMILAGKCRESWVDYCASEIQRALLAGADASLKDKIGRNALDYLKKASCGKEPDEDIAFNTRALTGNQKCNIIRHSAIDTDDLQKAEKLLEDALRQKH